MAHFRRWVAILPPINIHAQSSVRPPIVADNQPRNSYKFGLTFYRNTLWVTFRALTTYMEKKCSLILFWHGISVFFSCRPLYREIPGTELVCFFLSTLVSRDSWARERVVFGSISLHATCHKTLTTSVRQARSSVYCQTLLVHMLGIAFQEAHTPE